MRLGRIVAAAALALVVIGAAAQPAAPIVRLFELRGDPAQAAAFDAVGRTNVAASIDREPGVLAMLAGRPRGDASRTWVVEVYADAAAAKAHAESAHFQRFLAESGPLLTDKRPVELDPQFIVEQGAPLRAPADGAAPVARLREIVVRGDLAQPFRRTLLDELQQSMQRAPGLRAVVAATLKGKPWQWRVLEVYADATARDAHRQSAESRRHAQDVRAIVMDLREIDLEAVAMGSKGGLRFVAP